MRKKFEWETGDTGSHSCWQASNWDNGMEECQFIIIKINSFMYQTKIMALLSLYGFCMRCDCIMMMSCKLQTQCIY